MLFHNIKFPIIKSFRIVYQVSTKKKGMSTRDIAQRLGTHQHKASFFQRKSGRRYWQGMFTLLRETLPRMKPRSVAVGRKLPAERTVKRVWSRWLLTKSISIGQETKNSDNNPTLGIISVGEVRNGAGWTTFQRTIPYVKSRNLNSGRQMSGLSIENAHYPKRSLT
jgi:hypothetical protein